MAVPPKTAHSWSLTWDQFDQFFGVGAQATPADFDPIVNESGELGHSIPVRC